MRLPVPPPRLNASSAAQRLFGKAPPRFELGIKLLQSFALPLGYGALIKMERTKGFEPSTLALARRCSTPEPRPHVKAGDLGFEPRNGGVKVRCLTAWLIPSNSMLLWKKGDRWDLNP